MSKIAHYLQEHLVGEVMSSTDARRYFATDASIMALPPALVVYPRNENDVRKTARFTWQLAERGRVIPITARGAGSDQTGASLGTGIMLVFPAHLNRVLELDTKSGNVVIEAGINYGKLQQTLQTHGRFLPPYPASLEYSTVGGAIANNASGEKSVKYGDTRNYVQSVRAVLANGEVIETGRVSKRELGKKLGLATFEGELYRAIDTLLEENREVLETMPRNVTKNNAGYNLLDIKRRDGSFDLTPLLVGSQGTLAIITEATLTTEPLNPQTTLMMAFFDDLTSAEQAVVELRAQHDQPSVLEMIDGNVLEQVAELNPNLLKSIIQLPYPAMVLFIEFDNLNDRQQKKDVRKTAKILEKYATTLQTETEPEQQMAIMKVRQATATLLTRSDQAGRALPIVDGAIVPIERLNEYLQGTYALCEKLGIKPALWGRIGEGNLQFQPVLNIAQVGDRQKAFRLMDDYYALVISLGGSISGERNDGRLRAPYVERQYGSDVYALFNRLKQIFDPYNILNPGVKLGTTQEDVKALVRSDFNLGHIYNHLPRS
ncbi:MAG: FAD-binding oxidoreductase [Patescibacteria group bacterium]|nr:FAD-binding oxidoreductase [Patescibacteria group bacterium]